MKPHEENAAGALTEAVVSGNEGMYYVARRNHGSTLREGMECRVLRLPDGRIWHRVERAGLPWVRASTGNYYLEGYEDPVEMQAKWRGGRTREIRAF